MGYWHERVDRLKELLRECREEFHKRALKGDDDCRVMVQLIDREMKEL